MNQIENEIAHSPRFRFIGEQTWIDFINTERLKNGARLDNMPGAYELLTWLKHAGVLEDRQLSEADCILTDTNLAKVVVEKAHAFRAELRTLADNLVNGQTIPMSAVDIINGLLRQRRGFEQIQAEGDAYRIISQWEAVGPSAILSPIAESAAKFISEDDHSLLRVCGSSECIQYFYDTTKNHTRRWCSMESCGNRMKAAAFYERSKKRGQSSIK